MSHALFYDRLLAPIEARFGRFDEATLTSIVGFDAGGPLSLLTIPRAGEDFVTYVSCELAVRGQQVPSHQGRFELMTTVDEEDWALTVLSGLGSMSLEVGLDDGHTVDLGTEIPPGTTIEGVVLERVAAVEIEGSPYCVLACHGLTRAELEYAQRAGAAAILARLKEAGIYPRTILDRESVRLDGSGEHEGRTGSA